MRALARAPETDWFRVIADLERTGLTQAQIGDEIGRSAATVNNLKSIPGTEPRFGVGMALLGLWQERCRSSVQMAPTLD